MNRLKSYFKPMGYMIIFFLVCLMGFTKEAAAEEGQIDRVILLSVGGLNYEGYVSVPVPNIKYLISDGVVSEKALAVRSDTLEAAEASMLTGALIEEHKHLTVDDRVEVESVFESMKKNGRSVFVVDGSGGKLQSFSHGNKEYKKIKPNLGSHEIFQEAYKGISETNPFFSYIYFDDCAQAKVQLDQKAYYDSIRKFDLELGEFLRRLKEKGIYDNSLIILTSARSTSPSDRVPLVMSGPGCRVNGSTRSAMIIDVFPTICRLTGVDIPAIVRGMPVYGALKVDENEKSQFLNQWINDLLKDRTNTWSMNYQIEDQLNRTIHQMNSIKEEKQTLFNFAGEREQLIAGLKIKLTLERVVWAGIVLILIMGYLLEYFWLKRKFLLFK